MMGRHAMCHVHDGQACYVSHAIVLKNKVTSCLCRK